MQHLVIYRVLTNSVYLKSFSKSVKMVIMSMKLQNYYVHMKNSNYIFLHHMK